MEQQPRASGGSVIRRIHEPRYPGLITSMAILSTILNLILWIWIIQVAACLLMYCVALSKSFRQRGHSPC
jgi:hypothetical protein